MKKLLILFVFLFCGLSTLQSQTFKFGATAGIPLSDAKDAYTFTLGVDAYYYFTNIDALVAIGATAGYRNFFGDEVEINNVSIQYDDAQFLPIAAAARIKLFGILSAGADLGYAVGISDGLDGGLYFRPVVGIDIADSLELITSLEMIKDNATYGNFNVGVLFEF